MTNPSNEQFIQWVDQYLNDSIAPEDAQQLLECVQQDPARLQELRDQLQADQLLRAQQHNPATSELSDLVLQRIQTPQTANIIRPARWNTRTIARIAASLFVILGLGLVLKTNIKQPVTDGCSSPITNADSQLEAPPRPRPTMPLKKISITSHTKKKVFTGEKDTSSDAPTLTINVPEPVFNAVNSQSFNARTTPIALSDAQIPDLAPSLGPNPITVLNAARELGFSNPSFTRQERVSFGAGVGAYTELSVPQDSVYFGAGVDAYTELSVPQDSMSTLAPPTNESYAHISENEFKSTSTDSLSTFSIDVDTASYANMRRYLMQHRLPPKEAIRVEEMINYFTYDYAAPQTEAPFSTDMALHTCPWNENHHLLRIGLQGKKPAADERKPSNLVFLLDVSGSMNSPDKLPLLKLGIAKMIHTLGADDRIAIVVYAGHSGLVLNSTPASDSETILNAMNRLKAGGSTAGGAGIELAYRVAADHYIPGGINRVILATDGDFNVGVSNPTALQKLIEEKRESGVFLSVLGFGSGNLKDSTMELLANKGNGNYAYIDSEREAQKVLVRQLSANLETIAKDVKIQVEFNPAHIRSYRLIGYENRVLAAQDFADDTKDAGEIGAGHQVTALYELIPAGAPATQEGVPLKYSSPEPAPKPTTSELLTLKLRYKEPEGATSKLLTFTLDQDALNAAPMDESFRWATAVAAFGQNLRASKHLTHCRLPQIYEWAHGAVGADPYEERREMLQLIQRAMELTNEKPSASDYPQWKYR